MTNSNDAYWKNGFQNLVSELLVGHGWGVRERPHPSRVEGVAVAFHLDSLVEGAKENVDSGQGGRVRTTLKHQGSGQV